MNEKFQSQLNVLRNKRTGNNNPPARSGSVVRFVKPVERKNDGVNLNPPSAASVRRARAEKLLEQRKELLALKSQPSKQQNIVNNDKKDPKKKSQKGCSSCRRKK